MPLKGCLTSDFKFQDDAEVWRYEPRGQPNTVKVKHKNLEKQIILNFVELLCIYNVHL